MYISQIFPIALTTASKTSPPLNADFRVPFRILSLKDIISYVAIIYNHSPDKIQRMFTNKSLFFPIIRAGATSFDAIDQLTDRHEMIPPCQERRNHQP